MNKNIVNYNESYDALITKYNDFVMNLSNKGYTNLLKNKDLSFILLEPEYSDYTIPETNVNSNLFSLQSWFFQSLNSGVNNKNGVNLFYIDSSTKGRDYFDKVNSFKLNLNLTEKVYNNMSLDLVPKSIYTASIVYQVYVNNTPQEIITGVKDLDVSFKILNSVDSYVDLTSDFTVTDMGKDLLDLNNFIYHKSIKLNVGDYNTTELIQNGIDNLRLLISGTSNNASYKIKILSVSFFEGDLNLSGITSFTHPFLDALKYTNGSWKLNDIKLNKGEIITVGEQGYCDYSSLKEAFEKEGDYKIYSIKSDISDTGISTDFVSIPLECIIIGNGYGWTLDMGEGLKIPYGHSTIINLEITTPKLLMTGSFNRLDRCTFNQSGTGTSPFKMQNCTDNIIEKTMFRNNVNSIIGLELNFIENCIFNIMIYLFHKVAGDPIKGVQMIACKYNKIGTTFTYEIEAPDNVMDNIIIYDLSGGAEYNELSIDREILNIV